jgi:uncharacterized repeat protein (TIGR01451 family)
MRTRFTLIGLLCAAAALCAAPGASAAPLYDIHATWGPTNLPPGGVGQFTLQVRNIGDEAAEQKLVITDQLPQGVQIKQGGISWRDALGIENLTQFCTGVGTELLKCVVPAASTPSVIPPRTPEGRPTPVIRPSGYALPIFAEVEVDPGASGQGVNLARVSGGGAPTAFEDEDQVPFSASPAPFGVVPGSFAADVFEGPYPEATRSRQAGDHPFELRVSFDLTAASVVSPFDGTLETPSSASIRNAEVTLPPGLIGNPEAVPKCEPSRFAQPGVTNNATQCPSDTQVGYINVLGLIGEGNHGNGDQVFMPGATAALSRVPLYNLVPPKGTPVDLAFSAEGVVIGHIYAVLDPAHDYAIKAVSPDNSTAVNVLGAEVTIWGVPGDPAHDKFRYFSGPPAPNPEHLGLGAPFEAPIRPFFTNPSDCGHDNGGAEITLDSYQHPGQFTTPVESPDPLDVSGCEDPRFRFEPKVDLQPTDRHAGAPTGLDVHLEVPQRDELVDESRKLYAREGFVKGLSTPPIKKAVVTFPQGMTLNPSAAQGLVGCSSAQIGLGNNEPVRCPDASRYGTLVIHTPILPADAQPEGAIYIAKQNDNPFHNFLSLYLAIEEPERGIRIKIPGRIDLNKETGQITATFDDLPQFPTSDLQMSLKGGVRAGLVEPSSCGKKNIEAEFFTWQDPNAPHVVTSSFDVAEKPDGSPCVKGLGERPFAPSLDAGTENNTAGAYSPFVFHLTRSDVDQEFSQLGVTLPAGLTAKFAGVSECPESGISQALARETVEGGGALEEQDPSCPAGSRIGTTKVGTGVGVPLSWVPGDVYLAGPYKGAPLSMVVISPAVIGPFDVGVITVRTALNVNPRTAQGEALSDPFPQIFQGIPVRIRDIRLVLGRRDFTLNPTSCEPKQIATRITGTGGDLASTADDTVASPTSRFQAADCASLGFKPRLNLRLFGGTHRGAHPELRAVVKMPKEGANIAHAAVTLPHSEFLDQGHIRTVCTRVQFAARACPAGSIYGHAVAKTPLFDQPLEGNVYLGTGHGHVLPDLVAVLKGPPSMPVEIDLDGRIDSVHGGIRNTFDLVPDAPVETFTLTMQGGKKGLLVNSTNLCEGKHRANARFGAQNGSRSVLHPALQTACKKHGRSKGRRRKHR